MINTIFDRIFEYGLADWAVIFQGVSGVPSYLERLPASCVESFAIAELEKMAADDPSLDVICSLAVDSDLPVSELCSKLQSVCESKSSDMQRAKRIWRAFALEDILASLDSDPVYGLIKLSEFWSSWGWPSDAPPAMLLSKKTLSEGDYHSASNYDHVSREHEQWLKDELDALKQRVIGGTH